MADGVTLNPGTGGAVVDTEQPATRGFQIQRVKLVLGAVDVDGGDVASGNPMPTTPYEGVITQTRVTIAANTNGQLIAANATRKGLRWMNTGANPMTVVPGSTAATVNVGMNYNGNSASGFQGGAETFEGSGVPTGAFQAISLLGTNVTVWETN